MILHVAAGYAGVAGVFTALAGHPIKSALFKNNGNEKNNMDFERILLVVAGMVLALILDWCLTFWRTSENRKAQQEANDILRKHGYTAHLYMPGIGIDDPVLHGALDRIAFSGRVVIDQHGNIIGKLMPKVEKGPHLRLVIDNTK